MSHKCDTQVFEFLLILHSSKPAWHWHRLKYSPVPTGVRMLQMIDLKSMYFGDGHKFFIENLHHQGLSKSSVSSLSHRL